MGQDYGDLDEFHVYSRELSSSDVWKLANPLIYLIFRLSTKHIRLKDTNEQDITENYHTLY